MDEMVDAANRIHMSLGFAEPIDTAATLRVLQAVETDRNVATLLTAELAPAYLQKMAGVLLGDTGQIGDYAAQKAFWLEAEPGFFAEQLAEDRKAGRFHQVYGADKGLSTYFSGEVLRSQGEVPRYDIRNEILDAARKGYTNVEVSSRKASPLHDISNDALDAEYSSMELRTIADAVRAEPMDITIYDAMTHPAIGAERTLAIGRSLSAGWVVYHAVGNPAETARFVEYGLNLAEANRVEEAAIGEGGTGLSIENHSGDDGGLGTSLLEAAAIAIDVDRGVRGELHRRGWSSRDVQRYAAVSTTFNTAHAMIASRERVPVQAIRLVDELTNGNVKIRAVQLSDSHHLDIADTAQPGFNPADVRRQGFATYEHVNIDGVLEILYSYGKNKGALTDYFRVVMVHDGITDPRVDTVLWSVSGVSFEAKAIEGQGIFEEAGLTGEDPEVRRHYQLAREADPVLTRYFEFRAGRHGLLYLLKEISQHETFEQVATLLRTLDLDTPEKKREYFRRAEELFQDPEARRLLSRSNFPGYTERCQTLVESLGRRAQQEGIISDHPRTEERRRPPMKQVGAPEQWRAQARRRVQEVLDGAQKAGEASGGLGEAARGAAKELVDMMQYDRDPFLHQAAAFGLREMGVHAEDSAAEILILLLEETGEEASALLGEAFVRIGAPVVPALVDAWDEEINADTSDALAGIAKRDKYIFGMMAGLLENEDPRARTGAAGVFSLMGNSGRKAGPRLRKALRDEDPRVRERAFLALSHMRLLDTKAYVREIARCLIREEDQRAGVNQRNELQWRAELKNLAAELLRAIKSPDPGVRFRAALALGRTDPRSEVAARVLWETLAAESAENPLAALQVLGLMARFGGFPLDAVPPVAKMLAARDPVLRRAAVKALETMTSARELPPEARRALVSAQAMRGIRRCVKDEDWEVVNSAVYLLGRLGDAAAAALPELLSVLDKPHESTPDWAVSQLRERVLSVIPGMGSRARKAVPHIVPFLTDKGWLNLHAAEALGELRSRARGAVPALIKALDQLENSQRDFHEDRLLEQYAKTLAAIGDPKGTERARRLPADGSGTSGPGAAEQT